MKMIPIFCPKCRTCVGVVSTIPTTSSEDGIVLPSADPILNTPIDEIDWPASGIRSINALRINGIKTVGDLILQSEYKLLRLPNFGKRSLQSIKDGLAAMNLRLAP